MDNDESDNRLEWIKNRIRGLISKIDTDELLGEDTEKSSKELEILQSIEAALRTKTQSADENIPNDLGAAVGTRIGPVDDLPAELREQIKSVGIDELERKIIEVVRDFDGIASVDEILVGLYRAHGLIEEREQLTRKLYRMTKKALLAPEPKRRGIYRAE